MYFFKILSLIIILTLFAYAITLNQLKSMPKSIERDFYIWQFMKDKNRSKKEVIEASKLIFRVNSKLNKAFKDKTGLSLPKKVYKISYEDKNRYKEIFSKMDKKNLFKSWLKLSTEDKFLIFLLGGRENRKLLNHKLEEHLYSQLSKSRKINQFIFRSFKENLYNINKTILSSRPIKGNRISYNNLMLIGFKNLKLNRANIAKYFFYSAISKAKNRFDADRAIFWLYLSTGNIKYLKKVANSYDYNFYKLVALDFLKLPYPMPHTEKIDSKKIDFNISNPIEWAKLKKKIFSNRYNLYELAQKFNATNTIAYYYYILSKASRYKKQYFPMPYKDILNQYPINRQALILAIAKQESQFIPASISSSFAVGMMQFMPFLVKHIAKVRGEKVTLEDMFKPEIAIRFANTHLDYLNRYLYNPLFVAYAYNAGIGYTRRLIRKNVFKNGAYEPYLSIELVDNAQANYYGKKVLANYVIYRKLLGEPVKITKIINELTNPKLTDNFR